MAAGIKVDLSGVRIKVSPEAFRRGRYALGNQALADMDQFVPKMPGSGILRQSGHLSADASEILYQTPYAHYQFTLNGRNYSTPGTGPRWDLKAKSMFISSWVRAFTKGAGLE